MAAFNTFYKKKFTPEEIQECLAWFQERMDKLPASLSYDSANIPDLPRTVAQMVKVLQRHMNEKGTYNGQFSILLKIRQLLQEQGIE